MASRPAPTLDEVARTAGVSRSTASRAINGGLRVSDEAQAAVNAAVARLGYSPNRAARTLVTRRTDSIALVVPEPDERLLSDPFLTGTIRGVSAALGGTDLQLVLLLARPGESTDHILTYLSGGHVDGVIVASHHRDDDLESTLAASRLPAVFVGRPNNPLDVVYVDVDNIEGGRRATQRLIDAGRRRIATITGPQDMAAGVDRLAGWRSALADAGLSDTAVAIGDFTTEGGAEAMEELLATHPDIDAVFAASDLMAVGALGVLARHGRRVPADVSLVGFDDLGLAADATPPLTTVRNPVVEMVHAATELVVHLVGGGTAPPQPRLFPATLVERSSV